MKALISIAVLVLANLAPLLALAASDATCSESRPCKQGCCSKYGNCGFGPDFCSPKSCVSTCDAKSECGSKLPSPPVNYFNKIYLYISSPSSCSDWRVISCFEGLVLMPIFVNFRDSMQNTHLRDKKNVHSMCVVHNLGEIVKFHRAHYTIVRTVANIHVKVSVVLLKAFVGRAVRMGVAK